MNGLSFIGEPVSVFIYAMSILLGFWGLICKFSFLEIWFSTFYGLRIKLKLLDGVVVLVLLVSKKECTFWLCVVKV